MEFRDEMTVPNGSARGGYPIYRRPNNTRAVEKTLEKGETVKLDNRYVVPYVTGPTVTCYERHEAMLPRASRMSMKLYMPCSIHMMLTSITSKRCISRIYI